jgi:hypothetical protein
MRTDRHKADRDEARHIAFGHVALAGLYDEMTTAELDDREAFLLEAISLMSQRFLLREIWDRIGADVGEGVRSGHAAYLRTPIPFPPAPH